MLAIPISRGYLRSPDDRLPGDMPCPDARADAADRVDRFTRICRARRTIARALVRQTTVVPVHVTTVAESLPAAITASELVPLPAASPWRSCATQAPAPVVQYTVPAPVVTPGPRVEALRPVTDPAVPDGYVVGRSLMGEPKLFKPGQPMRNLIRYLSL